MSARGRGRGGESEDTSPSHALRGVEAVEESAEPPKRAVGGTAYQSSSPGEIIGGLGEMLVSKT